VHAQAAPGDAAARLAALRFAWGSSVVQNVIERLAARNPGRLNDVSRIVQAEVGVPVSAIMQVGATELTEAYERQLMPREMEAVLAIMDVGGWSNLTPDYQRTLDLEALERTVAALDQIASEVWLRANQRIHAAIRDAMPRIEQAMRSEGLMF
jgi:hypothetical protein